MIVKRIDFYSYTYVVPDALLLINAELIKGTDLYEHETLVVVLRGS